jgi:error-prone DNA polymerase
VIWESVFQRYSVLAKTMSFLGITGTLQVEDGVVHIVAEKPWRPTLELKPSGTATRYFH